MSQSSLPHVSQCSLSDVSQFSPCLMYSSLPCAAYARVVSCLHALVLVFFVSRVFPVKNVPVFLLSPVPGFTVWREPIITHPSAFVCVCVCVCVCDTGCVSCPSVPCFFPVSHVPGVSSSVCTTSPYVSVLLLLRVPVLFLV